MTLSLSGTVPGGLADEAGDGFRHDAAFLRTGPTLDEHLKVELLGGQAFEGVLTDGAEAALIYVLEQAFLEVCVAQFPGIVVSKDTFHVSRRQDFADDVEDRVVVKRITYLLEFLKQPLKHTALDGVRGDEVEDQAVFPLAVSVDAAHALFEAVRVPGDVVVEEDVAT